METIVSYDSSGNTIQGWMSEEELTWLYEQALQMSSIVEIGSWKGRSSHALLSGCKGTVYCIDTFQGSVSERNTNHIEAKEGNIFNIFSNNTKQFKNLITIATENKLVTKIFEDNSIDMIFIDGSHEETDVLGDIIRWYPKCKKLLCGHDWHQINRDMLVYMTGLPIEYSGCGTIWTLKIER